MKRTAIYLRVSSDRQAQEGDSIPAQRQALHRYIDEHSDMICVGEYLDDGISGTKEDRDELQRMLADVRDRKIDLILVTKLDRLYRSIRHYLNLQDTLDKYGVNWIAIWEPIYDTTTPQGRLIINQMMSIAQFEVEQTGQRIRQVQSYKISKGEVISGSVPVGYRIVEKRLVPDENAPYVREMFEYYSYCGNLTQTMRKFDHLNVFPQTKFAYKKMLMNTKYTGSYRGNDDFCEPIVGRDLYDDVQRKLGMNVKCSQKRVYIFSGLLRCAECGRAMSAGIYSRRGKESKRYRCSGKYTAGIARCGNSSQIYEHVLEDRLVSHLREYLENYIFEIEVKQNPINDNRKRKAAIQKRLDKLKELFLNDLITLEEYKTDREELETELADLKDEPIQDTTALKILLASPFEEIYADLSEADRRFFWRSIIKEIRFANSQDITVIFL